VYPSIIRAHSLDYSTLVLDAAYDNLPHVKYYEVATDQGTFRFAQTKSGVLPSLLADLAAFRKAAKKKMADAKARGDDFAASVHNGEQLAFKITMNSAYGFTGATKGFLTCVPIAASVTATGRMMIQQTKALVEKLVPGSRVVYGDSVAGHTPVLVRRGGTTEFTTFERLGDGEWRAMAGGKESCELDDVEVWSEAGWTKAGRVIRHSAGKPMVRVVTHTGVVDVTTDHSLLRPDGSPVPPSELGVGDRLLHADLPGFVSSGPLVVDQDEARIMGFFFGDGSAGEVRCASGTKATWALNNADVDLLRRYQALCRRVYPDLGWVIMESSGVYKLGPRGRVVDLVRKYRELMYSPDRNKVIPPTILAASQEVRRAFWEGMYDADGDKQGNRIDQPSQLSAACIVALASSLGLAASVNTRSDKDVYRVTTTPGSQRKDPDAIKKLEVMAAPVDAYVYDITTENHHFAAGVGRIVVHNTDSVMCILALGEPSRYDMHAHFNAAQALADEISGTFPSPVELEFEKVRNC
jgi:hypothetical protein